MRELVLVNQESLGEFDLTDRLDSDEVTVGRGDFLRITDSRVSRKHAVLRVNSANIEIKPIHKNPTFYYEATDDPIIFKRRILPKDSFKTLLHNDKISFLPDSLIFQVRISDPSHDQENRGPNGICETVEEPILCESMDGDCSSKSQDGVLAEESPFPPAIPSSIPGENEDVSPSKKRSLPHWMTASESQVSISTSVDSRKRQRATAAHSMIPQVSPAKKSDEEPDNSLNRGDDQKASSSKLKATPVAKRRAYFIDSSLDQSNISLGGPSSADDGSGSEDRTDTGAAQETPKKGREPCQYGDKCYRKNPSHLREFSHPADSDYDCESSPSNVDTPECPYGLGCYRRNARHRAQFRHTQRVTPARATKRTDSDNERDEDDVAGRSYDYEDSFIDDEEEVSDPEDSDFSPEKRTDASGDDEDDEDIERLIRESRAFTKNPKLMKPA